MWSRGHRSYFGTCLRFDSASHGRRTIAAVHGVLGRMAGSGEEEFHFITSSCMSGHSGTGLIFLDPTRAQSLRVATSRTRSAFVLSALPPAAAASGTVAVFAFALKAVVQSTFIYRLRRTAALSVRLEYQPSLGFVHGTHSGFGIRNVACST